MPLFTLPVCCIAVRAEHPRHLPGEFPGWQGIIPLPDVHLFPDGMFHARPHTAGDTHRHGIAVLSIFCTYIAFHRITVPLHVSRHPMDILPGSRASGFFRLPERTCSC